MFIRSKIFHTVVPSLIVGTLMGYGLSELKNNRQTAQSQDIVQVPAGSAIQRTEVQFPALLSEADQKELHKKNLLKNSSFENGTLSSWKLTAPESEQLAKCGVSKNNNKIQKNPQWLSASRSGKHALYAVLGGKEGCEVSQKIKVEAGKKYRIGLYTRYERKGAPAVGRVVELKLNGKTHTQNEVNYLHEKDGAFVKVSTEWQANATDADVQFVLHPGAMAMAGISFDDFFVEEIE